MDEGIGSHTKHSHRRRCDNGRDDSARRIGKDGGVIDDLVAYRLADDHFLVVANAANYPAVFRELTDLSYPAIARLFGGRDHTTVIHAVEKTQRVMKERKQVYEQVTELVQKFGS